MIFQPENNIGESSRPAGLIFCGNLSFLLQVAYVNSLGYLCPKPASLYAGAAVCVTTHKGSSIVTRSSSHLVRDMNQTQGSKRCFLFWKILRKRAIVALDACYLLHKAISISLSRFGDDRMYDVSDFKRRFPASQKILCAVWRSNVRCIRF